MTTALEQARTYIRENPPECEPGDDAFPDWASAFALDIDPLDADEYAKFTAWTDDNALEIEDQYEFQNPDGVENMNIFEIQATMYAYYVLTELALATAT